MDYFVVGLLVLFVLSGVVIPLLIEFISISGACEKSTFLIALPGSMAMSLSILTNLKVRKQGIIRWDMIVFIAVCDICSQILNLNGLIYAGSAIFTVVYSSVTIYTAVFARIFLNVRLQSTQWFGIFVVFAGLAIVSIGAKTDGRDVFFGVILILLGSLIHSLTYIASEYLLAIIDNPIAPELLCTLLGSITLCMNLIWQIFYTVPRYNEKLLGLVGSISTGLLKCAQTVIIFIFSHYAFCSIQKSQCFTISKGFSLLLVLLGVSIYTHYNDKNHSHHHVKHNNSLLNDHKNKYQSIPDSLPGGEVISLQSVDIEDTISGFIVVKNEK
eukprot:gene7848-10656_t